MKSSEIYRFFDISRGMEINLFKIYEIWQQSLIINRPQKLTFIIQIEEDIEKCYWDDVVFIVHAIVIQSFLQYQSHVSSRILSPVDSQLLTLITA